MILHGYMYAEVSAYMGALIVSQLSLVTASSMTEGLLPATWLPYQCYMPQIVSSITMARLVYMFSSVGDHYGISLYVCFLLWPLGIQGPLLACIIRH